MREKIVKLKIDLFKMYSFLNNNKLFFFRLGSCLIVPLLFGCGYIAVTKEYHFILYNILIGLFIFSIYELLFIKSINYETIKK